MKDLSSGVRKVAVRLSKLNHLWLKINWLVQLKGADSEKANWPRGTETYIGHSEDDVKSEQAW